MPQPRRRPSASLHGASLVIFGGFDGKHFLNDFSYINLHVKFFFLVKFIIFFKVFKNIFRFIKVLLIDLIYNGI